MAKEELFEGYMSAKSIAETANEQMGSELSSIDVREVIGSLDEKDVPPTVDGIEEGGKDRLRLYPEEFGEKVVSLLLQRSKDQNVEAA